MEKQTIEEQLRALTQVYGPERMLQACRNLIGKQDIELCVSPDSIVDVQHLVGIAAHEALTVINRFDEVVAANLQDAQTLAKTLNTPPEVPRKYINLLDPKELQSTIDALDVLAKEVSERPDPYGNKADLLKQKTQLDTAIKLKEATAIMTDPAAQGLKNEAQRDAFRRTASAAERTQLAEIEGQIAAIDVDLAKARDSRSDIELAAQSMQRKAALQTALLNFLAGGR